MKQYQVNKQRIAGYTLLVSGITAFLCMLIFIFLGYRFFLNPNIEFEAEQNVNPAAVVSDTISIPGFDTWTISEGETTVSTHFYNPEKNQCYFVLSVILDDTGEVIYESKYIKPSQHIYLVELNKALSAGTYNATLHFDTYSIADNSPLNGADMPFELVVK